MITTLSREQRMDHLETARTRVETYTLGPCKGYLQVRIPVWLAAWLALREGRKEQAREAADYARVQELMVGESHVR
jgi:hypothetical protein